MIPHNHITASRLAPTLIAVLMCLPAGGRAEPFGMPKPRDSNQVTASREAGAHRSRQSVPALIAILKQSPKVHADVALTAIHSLAQLGASEALPDINAFVAAEKDVSVLNYVKVAEARLLAERTVADVRGNQATTVAKLRVFCQDLDLSAARLNTVAAGYEASRGPWQYPPVPVEVYALREVADLLYDGHLSDYKGVPVVSEMDFSSDYPSLLKIRLMGLTRTARIDWIVSDLAHKKALTPEDDFELQLARDGGEDAARAAFAKLAVMDADRAQYAASGFDALIGVIDGADTNLSRAIRDRFRQDADPKIASAARTGGAGGGAAGY